MEKQKHHVYLSTRKMDYSQVPEGFTVFNDFGHAKTVVCGQVMSSGYGLLSYDHPLSRVVMDDYGLIDIIGLPEPFLKGLGAFI